MPLGVKPTNPASPVPRNKIVYRVVSAVAAGISTNRKALPAAAKTVLSVFLNTTFLIAERDGYRHSTFTIADFALIDNSKRSCESAKKGYNMMHAAVAELVDAQDSKSCEGDLMRVRLSPAAL